MCDPTEAAPQFLSMEVILKREVGLPRTTTLKLKEKIQGCLFVVVQCSNRPHYKRKLTKHSKIYKEVSF